MPPFRDRKGINQVVVVALLLAISIVAIAAIYAFTNGLMTFNKAPVAQFAIEDHPDVITEPGAKAFIIRHLGGDRINYNDLILAVYDSNRTLLYNKDVATAAKDGDVVLNQLNSPGYDDKFFEGGEQIIAVGANVSITSAGTYEIVLYYKPTMQPLVDREVMIS